MLRSCGVVASPARRRVYVRGARGGLGWCVADRLRQLDSVDVVVASGDEPADLSMRTDGGVQTLYVTLFGATAVSVRDPLTLAPVSPSKEKIVPLNVAGDKALKEPRTIIASLKLSPSNLHRLM